ncbi:MAG: cupin fold metalloprotein, WbuC family [Elusimicrobia bacterium]|nr:cupin fold metalloprotein, WbuC family [Elusimicrobiota bacterium]
MRTRPFNQEVLYAEDTVVRVSTADVRSLAKRALGAPRGRIRLCAHPKIEDPFHEMFIVHTRNVYVRPHKHLGKSESLHVIAGKADVVLFSESGLVEDVFSLSPYGARSIFYYRIPENFYHALIIRSHRFVFHEATPGPFDRSKTIFAPWAPEPGKSRDVSDCLKWLKTRSVCPTGLRGGVL